MGKKHTVPDAQVAAFLRHYKWLLGGKPRDRLAYRIVEQQREEIAWLRAEVDVLRAGEGTGRTWAARVGGG